MRKPAKLVVICSLPLLAVLVAGFYLSGHHPAVLSPMGPVASRERQLLIIAALMSIIVIVPVFALTFWIAWKYRATNTTATYSPDWDHNRRIEAVWWLIPTLLIGILSVITWVSSHQLDPARSLASSVKPITIQVVALDWKWLFIYPDEGIASVNYLQFPTGTPVNFQITADAPMNSFWIPQLGGQIYAMPGMSTSLHLSADQPGDYRGVSANLSGAGFAGMSFTARASSRQNYDTWVAGARRSVSHLDVPAYRELARPSQNNPASTYALTLPGLYNDVIMQYMSANTSTMEMH